MWCGKKAYPKRLHTVWFHLFNILKVAQLQKWRLAKWLPEVKEGVGDSKKRWVWLEKGNMSDPYSNVTVLHLDYHFQYRGCNIVL